MYELSALGPAASVLRELDGEVSRSSSPGYTSGTAIKMGYLCARPAGEDSRRAIAVLQPLPEKLERFGLQIMKS
jgi:hypothetical protein